MPFYASFAADHHLVPCADRNFANVELLVCLGNWLLFAGWFRPVVDHRFSSGPDGSSRFAVMSLR